MKRPLASDLGGIAGKLLLGTLFLALVSCIGAPAGLQRAARAVNLNTSDPEEVAGVLLERALANRGLTAAFFTGMLIITVGLIQSSPPSITLSFA